MSGASDSETWLREAVARVVAELTLFGRTFAAFLLHPGRSARDWQTGADPFMNPSGFAGMAAGAYLGVTTGLAWLWPMPEAALVEVQTASIASAVAPYVHYGLLGLVMHAGLRTLGSRRSLLGSLGVVFLVGGSVGTVAALLWLGVARGVAHARGTSQLELTSGDVLPLLLLVGAALSYTVICITMSRALMELHRTAVWKVTVAGVFAVLVTAILFGSVLPDGPYGWRPYIHVDLAGGLGFGFRG